MKTNVAVTSVGAYHAPGAESSRALQRVRITELLRRAEYPLTGAQMARILEMDKSAIAGRLNETRKAGLTLRTDYLIECPGSHKRVYGHYHPDNAEIIESMEVSA